MTLNPVLNGGRYMALSLSRFEKIDGLHDQLIRMGDFMSCEDPRGYIALSNRLYDACLEAGMPYETPNHEEWAANALLTALVSA